MRVLLVIFIALTALTLGAPVAAPARSPGPGDLIATASAPTFIDARERLTRRETDEVVRWYSREFLEDGLAERYRVRTCRRKSPYRFDCYVRLYRAVMIFDDGSGGFYDWCELRLQVVTTPTGADTRPMKLIKAGRLLPQPAAEEEPEEPLDVLIDVPLS